MTIGERIKEIRTKLGVSQVSFADKIGVSKQTLYKYENNIITNIPSDKIEAIAEIGGISPSYLMGWDDEVNLTPLTKFDDILKLSHNSGKSLFEITGLEIEPCDYECIKNPRFHEVQKNYYDRVTNTGRKENEENMKKYYLHKDANDAAQFLFENPEYKVLFDASRKVKKEDIDFVAEMIERMSKQ